LHDVGVAEAEQVERTADGTGVNGLPEPIQDEHGMFEYGVHYLSQSSVGTLASAFPPGNPKGRESWSDCSAVKTRPGSSVFRLSQPEAGSWESGWDISGTDPKEIVAETS